MRISNIQNMDVKNLQARLKALVKVGVSLSSIGTLDGLLSEIVDVALSLTDADGASLYLRKGDRLEFHISRNLTLEARLGKTAMQDLFERFEIPVDENSMAGWCAKTGMILNIPDVQSLPPDGVFHYNPAFDERNQYSSRSMLAAPLLDRQNEAVGVIQLWNATAESGIIPFDDNAQDLISSFASQAG
ncbi:MAG: hypothetical protein RL318_3021, partial [Fibrobacterota bacterium]